MLETFSLHGCVQRQTEFRDLNFFCPHTSEVKNFGLKVLATFRRCTLCHKVQVFFLGFLCPPLGFCAGSVFEINEEAVGNLFWRGWVFYALGNRSCLLYKYFSLFIIDLASHQSRMLGHQQYLWWMYSISKVTHFIFNVLGHKILLFPLSMKERVWSEVKEISSFSPHYLIFMQRNTYH